MLGPLRRGTLFALLAHAGPLLAQAGPPLAHAGKPPTPEVWTAPDGSRFVLLVTPDQPQVTWAIATLVDPAFDPPGLPGLAAAAHAASLGGTWRYGSKDVERERAALQQLDAAVGELLTAPTLAAARQKVAGLEVAARDLGDPRAFLRVLATAPCDEPQLVRNGNLAWLQLTTTPDALATVADLLVDRRENQVLRDLPRHWIAEVSARVNAFDADRMRAVDAELLALAMPDHPGSRGAERPGVPFVARATALARWAESQNPARTAHALVGGFDPAVVKATLARAFARTTLPTMPQVAVDPPRPLANVRRSTVPGVGRPVVAMAWALPVVDDPFLLQLATLWLGNGSGSWIEKALAAKGHKGVTVTCRAPWPTTVAGRSLFVVEVRDPAGNAGVADLVQEAIAGALEARLPPGAMYTMLTTMQRNWGSVSADPRDLAREFAAQALLWPSAPVRTGPEAKVPPENVQALLRRVFASKPAIVEGTP